MQACAELAAGQTDPALADVKLMPSLADSIKSEPFLISFLVRVACVQIAIQPVWEGLAEHRWTDAQLQELQARFLSYDFLADMQQPLKVDRACGVLTVDIVKKHGIGQPHPIRMDLPGEAQLRHAIRCTKERRRGSGRENGFTFQGCIQYRRIDAANLWRKQS